MYSSAGWAAWKTFMTAMVAPRPPTYPQNALPRRARARRVCPSPPASDAPRAVRRATLRRAQCTELCWQSVGVLEGPRARAPEEVRALWLGVLDVIPQQQRDENARDDDVAQAQHGKGRALAAQDAREQQFDGRVKGFGHRHLARSWAQNLLATGCMALARAVC